MPLSQPHADTMELDGTDLDSDRRVSMCVFVCKRLLRLKRRACVCTLRLMEHDRGEVDYHGNTCLSSSAGTCVYAI